MVEREITMREAIAEALALSMREDERVFVLGEDIVGGAGVAAFEDKTAWGGVFGVMKGFVEEFGRRRVRDTPISETAILGAAIGAALAGRRPVVELGILEFAGVALDQIVNQAAKMRYMSGGQCNVPMVVKASIGAGMGAAGQHSGSWYSVFAHFPGVKCVVPSTPRDAKGLLIAAIEDPDPVIFFENKTMYTKRGNVPSERYVIPIGRGHIVAEGDDITVVAVSRAVDVAIEVRDALEDEYSIEVVDLRSVDPIDDDLVLESVRKTGRLLVVDEDHPRCSVASDLLGRVAAKGFGSLRAAPRAVTGANSTIPFAPSLEAEFVPNPERVERMVRTVLES